MTIARKAFPPLTKATTGIGSLPHQDVEAALDFSFATGIPFLPQLPQRNAWEYMIPQALAELPGLQLDAKGIPQLSEEIWEKNADAFSRKLSLAFENAAQDFDAFKAFEPSASVSSCWQPFVWKLLDRKVQLAKIQIAGPLTSQEILLSKTPTLLAPTLATGLAAILGATSAAALAAALATTLAMTRRLQAEGVQPLLWIDEPGISALSRQNPKHWARLQDLQAMIHTLQKEGVYTGLHCCGQADWAMICELGLDFISFDAHLCAVDFLQARTENGELACARYLSQGGRLALGVIPTNLGLDYNALTPEQILKNLEQSLAPLGKESKNLFHTALSSALLTPACGLAHHPIKDAESILKLLNEFEICATKTLGLRREISNDFNRSAAL